MSATEHFSDAAHATEEDRLARLERWKGQRPAHLPRPVVRGPWRPKGAFAAALDRVSHLSEEQIAAEREADDEAARQEVYASRRAREHESYVTSRERLGPDFAHATVAGLDAAQNPQGRVSGWWEHGARTLLLAGPTSKGKTHAACAIANDVAGGARSGRLAPARVRVMRALDLRALHLPPGANAVRDEVAAAARNRARADLESVDLLVLDDLTAVEGSDWLLARVRDLLDVRVNDARLRTVVTLNVSEPARMKPELVERFGSAIVERLEHHAIPAWINGETHRRFDPWGNGGVA